MKNMASKIFNIFFKENDYDLIFIIRARFLLFLGIINIYYYKILYKNRFKIDHPFDVWGSLTMLIYGDGRISIGKNLRAVSNRLRSFITLYSPCTLTTIGAGQIIIGNNVGLNGTVIVARSKVSIGSHTMIAPNVIIMDHNGHNPWPFADRWKVQDEPKAINIGNNVWIGMNCLILKGVTINDGAVIAAGSIVTDDVAENSLSAGNPAIYIKKYYD